MKVKEFIIELVFFYFFLLGFTAEFDRVTKMPCRQSLSFTVKFDPKKAQLPLGEISVIVPIQVDLYRVIYTVKVSYYLLYVLIRC